MNYEVERETEVDCGCLLSRCYFCVFSDAKVKDAHDDDAKRWQNKVLSTLTFGWRRARGEIRILHRVEFINRCHVRS